MYSSYIGNLTVRAKHPIIVYGDVRGLVSEHRTLRAAQRSLKRDKEGCRRQRGYSDADIYQWVDGRWKRVDFDPSAPHW